MNQKNKIIRTFLLKLKSHSLPSFSYTSLNQFTTTSLTKFENRNLLKLKERGLVVGIFPDQTESFNKLISSGIQTCYCGFDPTASSLHIGNLLALLFLLHCQRSGHNPIVVIGSATALIGDPSGRTTERNKIENNTLLSNTEKIQKKISQIFKNHEEHFWNEDKKNEGIRLPKLKILNNIKWYENINIIQFFSNYGRHFRMGDLLSRKQIEARLASNDGISFTEFSYQIFQAYDWLHLNTTYNCNIQVGGNDQTGNMKTGYELISRVLPKSNTFSITIPIVTSEKGEKLGKSAGNAVWIDEELMSPFEFYQFFVNVSDQMVETYLKMFTFISLSEIEDIMKKHRLKPELFTAQKKLASSLTKLVHGEQGLQSALKCTSAFFLSDRESLARMSREEIEATFQSATVVTLNMEPGLTVAECALKAKCFKTLDLAMHIIKAGGFRMNHTLITNPQEALIFGQHILTNNISVIRVGKKSYFLVKWLA